MEDIEKIKIGVVIISMSLLTLIYPLTYTFVASLVRDLFEVEKLSGKKRGDLPKSRLDRIHRYRHLIGYVLTLFFVTGIAFILQFMLLQYWEEEHLAGMVIHYMPNVLLVILMFLSIVFVFVEIREKKYWMRGVIIAVGYVGVGIALWLCGLVSRLPESQVYCCLLNTGFLLLYTLGVWFFLGLWYKPVHALGTLRETVLAMTSPEQNRPNSPQQEQQDNEPSPVN